MTVKHRHNDGTYYTDQDIADLLGITLGRLRNKLTAGSPLPPRIQPPECRHRLWPREAVHAWLEQFVITTEDRLGEQSRHDQQLPPAALLVISQLLT